MIRRRDVAKERENESPRILRRRVCELLGLEDLEQVLMELRKISPRKAINPLISAFYDSDPELRSKAISAFGQVVADLANEDMEAARVVMRRLMWMLNDESGGIGWGAPEAMAEAMACHPGLAREYVRILLSYIREDGNLLEYGPLRRGALWGIGRLAQVYPEMLIELDAVKYVRPYLETNDESSRELSAWILRMLGDKKMEKIDQRVPFTVENIKKCICTDCPVQNTSQCAKEKMEKAKEMIEDMESGLMMPKSEDIPGLYCASGVATCKDIDTSQMCICGDCPLWEKYDLVSGELLGYYCRDGKAR